MNQRLFTFGCSITRYNYPTWADIIGQNFKYYENLGQPGCGNQYIFNSIIECDQRNHFTKDDTVLVMWTAVHRIDYYQFGKWKHLHGAFPNSKYILDDWFVPKEINADWPISCPDGYELLSYPLWTAAKQFLESKQVKYRFMTWQPAFDLTTTAAQLYKDTLESITPVEFERNKRPYQETYADHFKELYNQLAGPDWPALELIYNNQYTVSPALQQEINKFLELVDLDREFRAKLDLDAHPLPLAHLEVVKKHFKEYPVSTETEQWIQSIQTKLLKGTV
jgi:hypothetical protein